MPKLITHIRPHLDDVCAVWLLKKFDPELKDAPVDFIPTNIKFDGIEPPGEIYIGVGRGRFDEHKGDVDDCAASLVYKDLKSRGLIPAEGSAGLEKLVHTVFLEDTGRLGRLQYRELMIPSLLAQHYSVRGRDSAASYELGVSLCEALLLSCVNLVELEVDWEKRIEFDSVYGRAVALVTSARDADSFAYSKGFDLVVYVDRERRYHNIRAAADTEIDLTPVWLEIQRIEPGASWYFHHSKRMLICGGDLTRDAKPSRLTVEWLIDMLTPNYVRGRASQ
jgi:hypothetical protein